MADQPSILVKALTAGVSGCIADFATFPLDTAKVRLQIQGEGTAAAVLTADGTAAFAAAEARYCGLLGTVATIARQEGPKALYNGLSAGLQRQMCFASVRLGLYDSVKSMYQSLFEENPSSIGGAAVKTRIAAGLTTGALAVCVAQPTDVVKVRFQAQTSGKKYASTYQAYRHIASKNGVAGLWRGVLPNISRNAIINVAEIVCYDVVKDTIIAHSILEDGVPCHFASAVVAGLCATVVASPVDVVKTRYMNSSHGEYRGALDCAVRMAANEGPQAFYKGFAPSFCRLVSWNICMWITYEQMKKVVQQHI